VPAAGALLVALAGPPAARAYEVEGRYRVAADGALRVGDPVEPTRLRARAELELRVHEGFAWRGTLALRAFRDWALDRSRYSAAAREQQGNEVELRELMIGATVGPLDLVAGRRQVAWGALFGQFVGDRVVPFDLRDFLLPDADFIRRPLWMVGVLATGERASAEALLILERRGDRPPVATSEFALGAGAPPEETDRSRVALREVEPALRVETRAAGVDLGAFALLAHPDADPLATAGELGERDPVVGFSAAGAGGPYAVRGEAAVELDRPRADGAAEDVVRAGLAVDRALPGARTASLQCVHESASPGVGDGTGRTEIALRLAGAPAGGPLALVFELHRGFGGDWLARPRAAYSLGAAWLVELGADWFGGRPDTYYGQFNRQDRITLTVSRAGRWAASSKDDAERAPLSSGGGRLSSR
jgi:hypothetical protein